ncbi:B12-binding domain-containing radical SAM protein [Candidatus Omnitrophota bacterium]
MKIALFQPYVPDLNTVPSLGPLYLAAVLKKHDFDVFFFDEVIDRDAAKKALSFEPDLFGVTAVTPAYMRGLQVSRKIKDMMPATKVIFGGPHASAIPESVLKEGVVDYIVKGEGEKALLSLCRNMRDNNDFAQDLKSIRNLGFKDENGQISVNESGDFFSARELDDLPFPDFDLMDIERYFKGAQEHGIYSKGSKILPIMTSRGCPSTCTFCCRVMGSKIRERSVDNVISEIELLHKRHEIDELYIEDDNFTVNKKRAIELLQFIKDSPIRYLKFANGVNINCVDEEILQRMKEANVYSVSFGIESGSVETLKMMHKYLDLEKARKIINYAKSIGILVGANCIIGYPGETRDQIRSSLKYFFALGLDSMAIVNLVPFPGTEARKICEDNGYLTDEAKNWSNYYFSINNPIPLIETPWLSKDELRREIKKAYKGMYFNIFWIMKAIKHMSLSKFLRGVKLYFSSTILKKKAAQ